MTVTIDAPPPSFALIPFRDTEILAARVGDDVRIPMKRFCASIDIDWEPQRKRIERTPVLAEAAFMMEVPSDGGRQQQVALPLGHLSGFLMGLNPSRAAPERRDAILAFQRECYAVLHRHFFGRGASMTAAPVSVVARPAAAPVWQELDAARRSAPALIEAITAETRPAVRAYLHQLLAADGQRLGLAVPALADLGNGEPTPADLLRRLFGGLATLEARRVRWNHLGTAIGGRAGIRLNEIELLFRQHDIDVPIDAAMRAALRTSTARYRITEETVKSCITRKPTLLIVLDPWPIAVEVIDG